MNIRIRQVFYRHDQPTEEDFVPYFNKQSDHFLESRIISHLYKQQDHIHSDFYGVVSWKFRLKIHYNSEYVLERIKFHEKEIGHNSVYSFFERHNKTNRWNMWKQADNWHPDFSKIGKLLFKKLNYPDPTSFHCEHIYSNHWVAEKSVFEHFCSDMLLPAIKEMENDEELKELCFRDANYISRDRLTAEQCLPIFSRPYYTYHAFICERLFGTYCAMKKIKVKHL